MAKVLNEDLTLVDAKAIRFDSISDIIEIGTRVEFLARLTNHIEVIEIFNKIEFTMVNELDMVKVNFPTFKIHSAIQKILMSDVIDSSTLELVGLLHFSILGLLSTDLDCSETEFYIEIG